MIQRMTSKQLMDVLDSAEESMSVLRSNINDMKQELGRRMLILNNAVEFSTQAITKINENILLKEAVVPSTIILSETDIVDGIYDKYGISVLPNCPSTPTNVFNLFAATGPIFKNNANTYINGEFKANALNMLMHDAIREKGSFFEEYDKPDITLKISVNPNDLLGSVSFNALEILPYISGSFDIRAIRFQTLQDYRANSNFSSVTLNNTIPHVGASQIILEKDIELYSCEIDIHINFKNTANKYPFGLKHLYFLNKNNDKNSHVVIRVSRDSYIDWISDDITIHDQNGIRITSCTQENIKAYVKYKNNILESEIPLTRGAVQNSISRNIREFFLKVPVKSSITSIKFKQIGLR